MEKSFEIAAGAGNQCNQQRVYEDEAFSGSFRPGCECNAEIRGGTNLITDEQQQQTTAQLTAIERLHLLEEHSHKVAGTTAAELFCSSALLSPDPLCILF
eukprot:scaffold13774_cov161-Skeletonema_marinoi.AAC.1